jgi:hypothetical protein
MPDPKAPDLKAIEEFLAPLNRLCLRHPDLEGQVVWADGGDWLVQDDTSEGLDAEEIPFYCEGVMEEGLGLSYMVLAEVSAPGRPSLVLILVSPQPDAAELPPIEDGWELLTEGHWPATPADLD